MDEKEAEARPVMRTIFLVIIHINIYRGFPLNTTYRCSLLRSFANSSYTMAPQASSSHEFLLTLKYVEQ